MNYWISTLILAAIYYFVIFKIPEWIRKNKQKKSLVYEVKQPNEFPTYHCPKCGYCLIPLPPNPDGQYQCLHCQTYYNLKSGGSKCKTSAAPNVIKN